jgi:hypothetical protein
MLLLKLFAFLTPVISTYINAAPDVCTEYKTETDCLAAGARSDYQCSWCKCAAVPSSCNTNAIANRLPPSVFDCGNSTQTTCEAAKSNATCQQIVGCSWCTSKTVGPLCANFMNASSLPKSVFNCDGPSPGL